MFRRSKAIWICLLLVAVGGGYYAYGAFSQLDRQTQSANNAGGGTGQPYQQFWMERLGSDTQLTYHIEYSCGHDQLFSPEQLASSGLDDKVQDFDGLVQAMQVASQQAELVTVSGRLPVLCQDCQACYLVTEQDGYVTVFRGRSKVGAELIQCYTDMPVSRLPDDVQQRLRQGIVVYSDDELARVLEGLDG